MRRRTGDRKRTSTRMYDQLYIVNDIIPSRTQSSSGGLSGAAARYTAQFPSSLAPRDPTKVLNFESGLHGVANSLSSNRYTDDSLGGKPEETSNVVTLSHLDWLGSSSDASSRLLKSALDIARPFFHRATLPPLSLVPPRAAPVEPNLALDALVLAVGALEATLQGKSPRVLANASNPPPSSEVVADSVDVSQLVRKRVPLAGAIAQEALRMVSPRQHRRLEDTVAHSLAHLEILEACLPDAADLAASPFAALQLASGAGSSAVAARAEASALVDNDIAYLSALLAQAGQAMDAAMSAAVRHRGLVCSEEAELLSALWGSAAPQVVAPVLQRHVNEYSITRVDLELVRGTAAHRRERALHEAEHLVVTTTALDVRCLRLRSGLLRIAASTGQLSPEARSRCNTVIEWATALLGQARALLASAAEGDEEVAAVVGRAGSIRLDAASTWAPLRNMGREASARAQIAARSNDAIGAGTRLSLILEDFADGAHGAASDKAQHHHHHHHHHHHRHHHHHQREDGDAEFDAIDVALGADIDSHVRVTENGDNNSYLPPGTAARRSQQLRARGAVTKAVFAALVTDGSGEQLADSNSDFSDDDGTTTPAAAALVRRFSARFAARSAQQLRASTAAVAEESLGGLERSFRGRDKSTAAASVHQMPLNSSRPPLAALPSSRSGWWGDEPMMSQRTTELYQQVLVGGSARRAPVAAASGAPSSHAAGVAAQKRKAEADALAAASSAVAAAQAAAVERSTHLKPAKSAMRFVLLGTAHSDSMLVAALSTRHLKGGGVSFVPGAADVDDPRHTKHMPPSYSAKFESPEVRDAREMAESIACMAQARHTRRKYRIAGIRARREVSKVALGTLADSVSSASPEALLALVVSLRAASNDLSRESERLQADLGRVHHAAQTGASVTHAVWEARIEARRLLVEKHLGQLSGSRRTRHLSIDHAPLAADAPLSAIAALDAAVAAAAVAAVPRFVAPRSLGRRCSLPLREALADLSVSPDFTALLAVLVVPKPPAPKPLPPPSPRPPPVDVRPPEEEEVDEIVSAFHEESYLHDGRTPSPDNRRHAPHSPVARPQAAGPDALPSIATGAGPADGRIKPLPMPAQTRDVPRQQAPTPQSAPQQATRATTPRLPRLTEDGEVTEWDRPGTPSAAGRPLASAATEGSTPVSARPQMDSSRTPKMPAVVARALSRDGGRNEKKKQTEARIARSRASLASVLRSQLTVSAPTEAVAQGVPGAVAVEAAPPYPLKWALAQITAVANEWELQFRALYLASMGEGGAAALEWLAEVAAKMANGRPAPKGHGPSHSQGLEMLFPLMFVPPLPPPTTTTPMGGPGSVALGNSASFSGTVPGDAGDGAEAGGSPKQVSRKPRKSGLNPSAAPLSDQLLTAGTEESPVVAPARAPTLSMFRGSATEVGTALAMAPRGITGLLRRQNSSNGASMNAILAARQLKALEADRLTTMLRSAQGGGLANNGTPRATNPKIPFTASRRGRLLCCDPNVGNEEDPAAAVQGMSMAIAHSLREPADPASFKISEGRLDWFIADHFQRSFGLQALAMRHINTLLKCIRGYRADKRIATFAALLSGALPTQDILFLVTVRALCRAGTPLEAWTLVGQLPGGLSRYRAFKWWHFFWAVVVLRRWLIRTLQNKRGRGACTMLDNFRARVAIKNCIQQNLISIGSGTSAESRGLFVPLARSRRGGGVVEAESGYVSSSASIDGASASARGGMRKIPPLQGLGDSSALGDYASVPTVNILSALRLSPRTEMSMRHCAIAARDPMVLSTFPFLSAAAPLLSASTVEAQLRFEGEVVTVSGSPIHVPSADLLFGDEPGDSRAVSPEAAATRFSSSRRGAAAGNKWAAHVAGTTPSLAGDRVSPETVASGGGSPVAFGSPGRRSRGSTFAEYAGDATSPARFVPSGVSISRLSLPQSISSATVATAGALSQKKLLWCTSKEPPQSRRLDKSVTGFTFWSPHRLSKLLLMLPAPAACKGLFLKSGNHPKSLAYPDTVDNVPGSVQGLPPWVSATRAREIAKLLLLPKDVPAVLTAIDAACVRGLPSEWSQFAPKWPQRLVGQLTRTKRIGADTLSTILLASRQAAREEYREALATDFFSYNSSGGGSDVMPKNDVIRAVSDAFPGMFSREFAEQLFILGALTPPRSDRRLESDEAMKEGQPNSGDMASETQAMGTAARASRRSYSTAGMSSKGWTLHQFIMHMLDLSENVLL